MSSSPSSTLTAAERYSFDTQGYLVLENFFAPDHVARLRTALAEAVKRRRASTPADWKAAWPPRERHDFTALNGPKSTRILNLLEEDPLLFELLFWPALQPYVRAFIHPEPHYLASDAIVEDPADFANRKDGWHIDGSDNGFRRINGPIPMLQLKLGIYLTDMTKPWRGNLTLVPGSHLSRTEPSTEDRKRREFFPAAKQICAPAGSAIFFHNAVWHTAAPYEPGAPGREILYYAWEQPWMLAHTAHWCYSKAFYAGLKPAERKLFHGFVFDPPEWRSSA